MLRRAHPDFRRLGLVSALIAAIPGALLAQDRPGAALPPPSLYDPAPPPAARAQDVISTPRSTAAPAAVDSATAAPAAQAAPRESVQPAASSAPAMAGPSEPVPQEPWYRRWWSRMFGDGGTAPAPSDPTMVAAVTPSPASSTPPVTLPAARASATVGPRGGYAQDSPERTIRTGVLGECVKTGMWEPSDVMIGCGAGQTVAKVDEQAALPAAVRAEPQVEPVEVQPLATPALKEEKTLEVEPVAAPQPEPAPEPPVAIPEPPKPQMTTLSADALFAVGSHQLKPAAKASLDDFAAQLKSMDFESIRIVGHTDPTGKAAMNDRLSRQRAESVKRYLVGRGIPADRIQTEGVGSSMPMVVETDCATLPRAQKAACYQPDRRVEIEVQGVTSRVAAQ